MRLARPSTVRMSWPSAIAASVRQALIALPSMRTVQAPHIPMPHPSRTLCSRKSSRSTSSSVWWPGTLMDDSRPLTRRVSGRISTIDAFAGPDRAADSLGSQRNRADRGAYGRADRVPDCWRDRGKAGLAEAVDLSVGLGVLGQRRREPQREVRESGDVVIGEVRVRDLAAIEEHLLEQRLREAERRAALVLQ